MCPSAPAPSVEMEDVSQVHVSPMADEVDQQATPPEVTTVEEAAPDPPSESCCVGGSLWMTNRCVPPSKCTRTMREAEAGSCDGRCMQSLLERVPKSRSNSDAHVLAPGHRAFSAKRQGAGGGTEGQRAGEVDGGTKKSKRGRSDPVGGWTPKRVSLSDLGSRVLQQAPIATTRHLNVVGSRGCKRPCQMVFEKLLSCSKPFGDLHFPRRFFAVAFLQTPPHVGLLLGATQCGKVLQTEKIMIT